MRVLIVDEDRAFSDLLKKTIWVSFYAKAKALAKERQQITDGLEVQQFETYAKALTCIKETKEMIDLIFVEINSMDVMGLEFIRTCSATWRAKYHAIVIVTERGRQQDIDKGLAAGAQACLLKPFSPEDLIEHIFRAWNRTSQIEPDQGKELV